MPAAEPKIEFQSYDLPHSLVRVVSVPASGRWEVRAGIAPGVDRVEDFATQAGAVVAINAGFFDPNNQKSTSYVFRDGQMAANPEENDRLTGNPQLQQYLPQIFNRTEWRRYRCGDTVRYAIAPHRELPPEGCLLLDAIGAGPQLLPELTAEAEAFITPNRDPIGVNQRNARSAIAIKADGSLLFAIASQKPDRTDSGLSLPELSEFLRSLGVVSALNLDGGSSTALYYRGQTFYGKLDEAGNAVKRPVKSVIFGKPINPPGN
nr:phosphodiester glycosidase family protein [Oscillatoria sp. FACHB-1406]